MISNKLSCLKPMTSERIEELSSGEVLLTSTLNFRNGTPKDDGLLCQKIFGPVNDYKCACGKYKGKRYNNVTCEKCGVLVTRSLVRSRRFGHISFPVPILNPITYESLRLILGISRKILQEIIYGDVTIELEESDNGFFGLVDEEGIFNIKAISYTDIDDILSDENRSVKRSSIALYEIVNKIDISKSLEIAQARLDNIKKTRSKNKRLIATEQERVFIFNRYIDEKFHPKHYFLWNLPVSPANGRMVVNMGDCYSTNSRNYYYARIIRWKSRLERILSFGNVVSSSLIEGETICLQQAVEELFVGGAVDTNGNKLGGIISSFSQKEGLPRHNLLGKRVDFSGRSVITSGPDLKLNEIGIPVKMLYTLLEPHLIKEMLDKEISNSYSAAKRLHLKKDKAVYDLVYKIAHRFYVVLNRAPTLHRYGLMGYKVVPHNGHNIMLPPMTCAPFNADFDGDQMAVHLPLSPATQKEVKELLDPSKNILNSSDSSPNFSPSHEMVVGAYYMTNINKKVDENTAILEKSVSNLEGLHQAGHLKINDPVKFKEIGKPLRITCLGRLLIEQILQRKINTTLNKGSIKKLISTAYDEFPPEDILEKLKKLQDLFFHYATISGISLGKDDFFAPSSRNKLFNRGMIYENKTNELYKNGSISKERHDELIVREWMDIFNQSQKDWLSETDENNSLLVLYRTKSRVSMAQVSQLVIGKGIIADSSNRIIPSPIKRSLRDGLSVYEHFSSCTGGRKGLSDKKFVTPKSGFLARKLITSSRDLYITGDDCKTTETIKIPSKYAIGRYTAEGERITEIPDTSYVMVRSPISCEQYGGICKKCYGNDISKRKPILNNTPVGIIAAQSLTEPTTQMSMRTFHISGAANLRESPLIVKSKTEGIVRIDDNSIDHVKRVYVNDDCYIGHKNSYILVEDGQKITIGDPLITYVKEDMSNDDIVGKLPLLEAYFEARSSKKSSIVSLVDGIVSFEVDKGIISILVNKKKMGVVKDIPIFVYEGQYVKKGEILTYGELNIKHLYNKSKDLNFVGSLFVERLLYLYNQEGVFTNSIHLEMMFRSMTELVIKEEINELGLRRYDKYSQILIKGVNDVGRTYPSWLKGIGYGFIRPLLEKSIKNLSRIYDTPSEKIMMGRLVHDGLGD